MHHREKMSDQCSQGEKHTKMTLILIKKLFQKTDILMVKLAYLGSEASNLKKDARFGFSESRNVLIGKKFDEKMRWDWDPLLSQSLKFEMIQTIKLAWQPLPKYCPLRCRNSRRRE